MKVESMRWRCDLCVTCGLPLKDRCRNSDVRERCGLMVDVVTRVERGMMRRRERMNESRLTKQIYRANGRIQMQGSYHSIATSSLEYARLLIPSETEKQIESDRSDYEREVSRERSIKQRRNRSRINSVSSITSLRSMSLCSSYADLADLNLEGSDKFLVEKPVVINAEESSKGAVQGSVGMHYIKAATNWFGIILAVLLFTGTQALASFFDYFIAFWTSQEEKRQHHSAPNFTTTENSDDVFKSTPLLKHQ
ncbi:hypothetical protein EVAR_61182_1 [Eumeta japonica]|uniref:Uncharacterized protein n=1 Tax=Eumeta variegata TaxID=151549 RepID=A0A4C1ZF77_EUMVA|nr:hypothetical protein EVAR_61182_1 [Eumeta japonica]